MRDEDDVDVHGQACHSGRGWRPWQLQQLMDRKRKLAQDLLAPPAFTAEDYKALVAGTLRAKV